MPTQDELRQQAADLNASLGLKDSGNLDSFLSGRASWDEYQADEQSRATNDTGDRLYDSQDETKYDTHGNYIGPPVTGGGGGGGGGTGTNYPRDGGASATMAQFQDLLGTFNAINNDPVQLPEYPLPSVDDLAIEVPGENLSPAIDDTLLDVMGRNDDPLGLEGRYRTLLDEGPSDPLGLQGVLSALLARTAGGGINSERLQQRNEGAREQLSKGSAATLADMKAMLADRGLISMPGAPQGLEAGESSRLLEPLQKDYLSELRQAYVDESQLADKAESDAISQGRGFTNDVNAFQLDALSKATGWSQAQVQQRLAAANSGTERQKVMADIALGTLDRNMAWNKFLAEFGLEREKVAADIKKGKMDAIAPVIQMFLALLSQSRGGYI